MEITKDDIKQWLSEHPERDRDWLAEQCGVEKRTVDNWLSSPQKLPSKALRIIESLMRVDEQKKASAAPALQNVVVRVDCDEFDDWNRAAMAHGQLVSEYCLDAIRAAYAEDQIKGESQSAPAEKSQKTA